LGDGNGEGEVERARGGQVTEGEGKEEKREKE